MTILKKILLMMFFIVSFSLTGFSATYTIDKDHSSITFKIRHLLTKVQGTFNDFSGEIQYDPDHPETWEVNAVIQTASIDTANVNRDNHLRSPDFFDVEKNPLITFDSVNVDVTDANHAKVNGTLILHGVKKEITLDVDINGVGTDPWGSVKAGFSASAAINRKDFGIVWNEALDSGQFLLCDDVEIRLEIEGLLKK